ncbi:MAG: hypothetical protein ACOYNL_06590 [Rickettsiales bacterium]
MTNNPSHSPDHAPHIRPRSGVFWRRAIVTLLAVVTVIFVLTYSRALQGMTSQSFLKDFI